ncbi:zinc finger protein Xfin-like [Homalodisca vitripennis]|uniref:zinc finger protein Xfin-like n=1 Tax=Homalodisca vitripennis TaxID=197043 RepID=UPI001EEB8320|nr:zinc finger protein Xfin-like [Homalodisca vitripennis]
MVVLPQPTNKSHFRPSSEPRSLQVSALWTRQLVHNAQLSLMDNTPTRSYFLSPQTNRTSDRVLSPDPCKSVPCGRGPVEAVVKEDQRFRCNDCGKSYVHQRTLIRHVRYECGKLPRFSCRYCDYRAHHKNHVRAHIGAKHVENFSSGANRM